MTEERWKQIPGYEGAYEISSHGRVRNAKGEILKSDVSQRGYVRVQLWKNGDKKNCKVHRLVAESFIANPLGLAQINHINELKTDNHVENLEWTNNQRNTLLNSNKTSLKKPVAIVNDRGKHIATFESIGVASRISGVDRFGIISVCLGHQKKAGGYAWEFIQEDA